jgi:hypothetical protein
VGATPQSSRATTAARLGRAAARPGTGPGRRRAASSARPTSKSARTGSTRGGSSGCARRQRIGGWRATRRKSTARFEWSTPSATRRGGDSRAGRTSPRGRRLPAPVVTSTLRPSANLDGRFGRAQVSPKARKLLGEPRRRAVPTTPSFLTFVCGDMRDCGYSAVKLERVVEGVPVWASSLARSPMWQGR